MLCCETLLCMMAYYSTSFKTYYFAIFTYYLLNIYLTHPVKQKKKKKHVIFAFILFVFDKLIIILHTFVPMICYSAKSFDCGNQ